MRVAVIGAGLFGISAAVAVARRGHHVTIFEALPDILQAASGINQYRLHRGYHYPRSSDTVQSSLAAEPLFREEYAGALITDLNHYYAIAKEKSLVTAAQFLEFCRTHALDHEVIDPSAVAFLNPHTIQLCVRARESLIDITRLTAICRQHLRESNVEVRCNERAHIPELTAYDRIVVATYAGIGDSFSHVAHMQHDYQYEVCEKIVVQLPPEFADHSIVIMDGPFTCADPYGSTGYHVMGNVVHAIHATNIGRRPLIPDAIAPLLNRGVISQPPVTNFEKFIEAGAHFMPGITKARHIGSMYTVRTVLPHVDATDARPSLVEMVDDRVIKIFSGKLGNCVDIARQVANIIDAA